MSEGGPLERRRGWSARQRRGAGLRPRHPTACPLEPRRLRGYRSLSACPPLDPAGHRLAPRV